MPSTSLYVKAVMLSWWIVAAIFGVEMQLAQSSVGKTLLSRIIFPPTLASFSTTQDLVAHVAQLEGGFHPPDAAADDEHVVVHGSARLRGPEGDERRRELLHVLGERLRADRADGRHLQPLGRVAGRLQERLGLRP